MRGITSCYLCGGDLSDRFNLFNASGLLTHKVCPTETTVAAGWVRPEGRTHLLNAQDRPVCGAQGKAPVPHGSYGQVDCERCIRASSRELLRAARKTRPYHQRAAASA